MKRFQFFAKIAIFIGFLVPKAEGNAKGITPGVNGVSTSLNYGEPLHTSPDFEAVNVFRIQLRINTCNNEDAGSDDDVYVTLNGNDDRFYLNKSNDFEKGEKKTFDILSSSIKQVKDISFIKLGIRGDNGTCLRDIELLINNNKEPIYKKYYPDHGEWIDKGKSVTISTQELRSHSGWGFSHGHKTIGQSPAGRMSKEMIVSMVEASIGNELNQHYGADIAWGSKKVGTNTRFGPAVEANYVNDKTLHFDLDLEHKLRGPNPELDVDFDLVFSCRDGRLVTEVQNLVAEGKGPVYQIQKWLREKGLGLLTGLLGTTFGHPLLGATVGAAITKYLTRPSNSLCK